MNEALCFDVHSRLISFRFQRLEYNKEFFLNMDYTLKRIFKNG